MTRVVVVGGGYTGVWAARRLLRSLGRARWAGAPHRGRTVGTVGTVEVTLVSAMPHHAFHGWTAEVLTGHVALPRTLTPLRELLPGAHVLIGEVVGVDLAGRAVAVATPDGVARLPYDHLVLGAGSRDASARVPGLADADGIGFTTKGEGRLARLCHQLDDVVARAAAATDPAERDRLLTVVVAGGGYAGVETAVAVRQRVRAAALRAGIASDEGGPSARPAPATTEAAAAPATAPAVPRVVLVHSGTALVPALRPRFDGVADHAAREVARAGVEIRYGVRVSEVTPSGTRLSDGTRIRAATVVSTLGQAPVSLPGTEELVRDATGRIVVDERLRALGPDGPVPGVWAGGDIAAVPHPGGGTCPANALWAMYQGTRAGANVARALRGAQPRRFRFPGLGQAASFGVGRGAGELYGLPLLGWSAWLARWVLFHYYMPSRRSALTTAREWFRPQPSGPGARPGPPWPLREGGPEGGPEGTRRPAASSTS